MSLRMRSLDVFLVPASLLLLGAGAVFGGCDSDPAAKPGTLTVHWELEGIGTCDGLGLVSVVAIATNSKDEPTEVEADCEAGASEGTIVLTDLPAGKYTVAVEGITAEDRHTHRGVHAKSLSVPDGGEADNAATPILLTEKHVNVIVRWDWDSALLGGSSCTAAKIDTLHIEIFSESKPVADHEDGQHVSCNTAEFVHPDTGETEPGGVVFADLPPMKAVQAKVTAFDKDDVIVAEGLSEPKDLIAGDTTDDHDETVKLTPP